MRDYTTEQRMNSIKMIHVDEIHQHPKNPRLQVGDVKELASSIKAKGIMQNLTVIRGHYEGDEFVDEDYTVIIGHRRCAAAKEAGVEYVPCQIVEMDEKDQVATMLLENMQREDLTPYEQGQGFQMMLDLGEDIHSIKEKTGFATSTIYHRVNLAKLDQETLKEKQDDESFQMSLKDMYELEKIKDIDARNRILKNSKNSNELVYETQRELQRIENEKRKAEIEAKLEELGVKPAPKEARGYNPQYKTALSGYMDGITNERIDELSGELYYYWDEYGSSNYLYVREKIETEEVVVEKTEEEIERERRYKELEEHKAYIDKMQQQLHDRAVDLVRMMIDGKVEMPKSTYELYDRLIGIALRAGVDVEEEEVIAAYRGKTNWQLDDDEIKKYAKLMKKVPRAVQLMLLVAKAMPQKACAYKGYQYDSMEQFRDFVKILKESGFTVSDEEEKVISGTHEYYEKEQEDA